MTSASDETTLALGRTRSQGAQLVLAEIARHQDELAGSIADTVLAQVPAFERAFGADRFRADVAASLGLLHALADGDRGAAEGRRYLAKVGAKHARDGIPLEDSLRAWQVAGRVIIGYSSTVADDLGVSAAEAVEVVDALLTTIESVQRLVAGAHREAEVQLQQTSAQHRASFVRSLLTGRVQISARAQASAHGLDPSREYVAVRISCTDEARLERIVASVTRGAEQRGAAGAVALIDGHLGAILASAPPDLQGAVSGVGPPRSVERLHESFAMATRALHTALALGLHGTHAFDDLALEAAVVADTAVGAVLARRHLDPLGENAIARELRETLREYLAAGLNVEQTAARLTVHQNTVRYRLAKFEELTGARMRDPKTQFEVWWALNAGAIAAEPRA